MLSVSAGLGSRDVSAGDLAAVFDRLLTLAPPAIRTTPCSASGTRSRSSAVPIDIRPAGSSRVRGHSIGGLGSVTTNKLLATLIGELFGKYVQAYPRYGSEKKGLPTSYNLTIADVPIRSHGEVDRVDFVPFHDVAAFALGDPLHGLIDGGTVFVQSSLTDPLEIWESIPASVRPEIVARRIRVTALDTGTLARSHAPRPDLVLRMQGIALVGVFLRVTRFAEDAGLDRAALLEAVGSRLRRFYGKRGDDVIAANMEVVAAAYDGVIDVSRALGLPCGVERSLAVTDSHERRRRCRHDPQAPSHSREPARRWRSARLRGAGVRPRVVCATSSTTPSSRPIGAASPTKSGRPTSASHGA